MTDVIIIGGGPAGSTLGSYLSQAGISNIIFEKTHHPRPHVGESLVPSTTRVFKEIGFLETMEREGFVKKYGAAWHPYNRRGEFDIEFKEFPQEGVDQDYTYHVDRGKFDLLMLKHAASLGSKVYQGVHVQEVLLENGQAKGVRFKIGDQNVTMPCKVVVDATGRDTLLGRQLKIKKKDPIFNQYAVHAWYENVNRGEGRTADFIHIYFLPVERGWVWQIPITEQITSIGVVAEKDYFKQSKLDVEEYFNSHLGINEDLKHAMQGAKRINEFRTEGDYSYTMEKFVGDGYLMIGDAARFVDPIFSSGISVAVYSAKFAAEQIVHALEIGDFSAETFMPYMTKLKGGVEIWYEFIRLYYKLLHLFTYFIRHKKHRLEVLQLLQGEVYERTEAPVLDEMRKFIDQVEKSENHLLKEHLTAIPID
ncbi:NAD(P)/FAD-dependent oxidoreductase [Candidatus Parcubacteria bacterium]|nr:MAG: NAD(P)/FAD-dependent oxidoreductase [Candidatus Parcubacteria bacterium]